MVLSAADYNPDSDAVSPSAVFQIQKREETYKHILLRLFFLLKVRQEDDSSEDLLEASLIGFHELLCQCLDKEGSLVMSEQDGFLFLNGVRARVDLDGFSALKYLVQALLARGLTGVLFESGLQTGEILDFLDVFVLTENGEHQAFTRLLADRGVKHIHAIVDERYDLAREFGLDRRMLLKRPPTPGKTYFKRILVVKHLLNAVSSSCPVTREETHQLLQELALGVLGNESYLLALDELEDWNPELYSHSVSVAVISLALAVRMGLSEELLQDLGIAALFHDIGLVGTELSTAEDRRRGERRSATLRRLFFCAEPSDNLLRSALAVDELYDVSTSLLARILDVANAYDSLVKKNMASGESLSPEQTLVALQSSSHEENQEIVQLLMLMVLDQ